MGKEGDPLRVVDSSGRVVGTEGLRVADTSVVPVVMKYALSTYIVRCYLARLTIGLILICSNHPQVSAYLVADVVADRLLEDWDMLSTNGDLQNGRKKRKLCDSSALLVI